MKLSPRQREIYRLTAEGLTEAKQIAEVLGIEAKTVQVHRDRMRRKLSLRNKDELLLFVACHPELGRDD